MSEKTVKTVRMKKFSFGKLAIYFVLSLWALTTIFPFLWVANNSFKAPNKIMRYSFLPAWDDSLNYVTESVKDPETGEWKRVDVRIEKFEEDLATQIPQHRLNRVSPTWRNYIRSFNLGTGQTEMNIGRAYMMSLIISGSVTILVMLFGSFASFALVRYKFRGREVLNFIVLMSLMFPAFSTIIPVYRMLITLNLLNNPIGVILPQVAGNLSFAIIILTGYIRGLPVDLEEAAFLEGCNVFQIFFRIMVPITLPSLSTVAIFAFLWSYNDLFLQRLVISNSERLPICAMLAYISSQWGGTDYGLMCAAVTLVFVPVLIVYIFLQKNIIKGLTAGALKG